MNKSSFFIVGKHAVFEALKNEKRKILRLFLTNFSFDIMFLPQFLLFHLILISWSG